NARARRGECAPLVPLPAMPSGLLARYHAARSGVLSRAHSFGYGRSLRPCLAWCYRPRSAATSLDGALGVLVADERVAGPRAAQARDLHGRHPRALPTWVVDSGAGN